MKVVGAIHDGNCQASVNKNLRKGVQLSLYILAIKAFAFSTMAPWLLTFFYDTVPLRVRPMV